MDKIFMLFVQIMLFYIFLSYLVMPALFYYFYDKSVNGLGTGFAVGSLLSVIMWYGAGRKMVTKNA